MIESILSVIFGLMLSCLSIILSKREGRFDLFAPPMIVTGIMWLQYFLPAFTLPYFNYWVYPHQWGENQVVLYPVLVSSIAWLAFLLGYRSKWGKTLSQSLPTPVSSCYTKWIAWALTIIGLNSLLIAVERSGGLLQIMQSGSIAKGTGIWMYLGFLTLYGIALLWSYEDKISRIVAILASIIYFIILLSAQGRGAAITVFIVLLVMTRYLWNIHNITLIVIGSTFALFAILFGSIGRLLTTVEAISSVIAIFIKIIENFIMNMLLTVNRDLSRLEQLSIVLELIPKQHNYLLGVPILQSLFGPFKKYLFPDSVDWRIALTSIAIYGQVMDLSWGMGGTGVGEWYANFGLGGVVIGWILWGVGARCLYEWFQRSRQIHPARITVAVYVLLLNVFWGCISESTLHISSLWWLLPVIVTIRWKKDSFRGRLSYCLKSEHR
jgi:hypothetical protein